MMDSAALSEACHSAETVSGYTDPAGMAFAAPTIVPARRLCEEADDYPRIVARLNSHWRVIDSRCGLQWILQRQRRRAADGSPRWEGSAFCRTRDGLLSNIRERCGDEAGLRAIDRLPVRHP